MNNNNCFSCLISLDNRLSLLPTYGTKLIFLENVNTASVANTHVSTRDTNSVDLFIHADYTSSARHCHALLFINFCDFNILLNLIWCESINLIALNSFGMSAHGTRIIDSLIVKSTSLAPPNCIS